ncbi:MAG: sugar nucleotide-binding protein [Kocuria sp.]|nr:sugar nucleotide-binding protein [Kocuria sp.]
MTDLRVHHTSIPGLLLLDLPVHGDHRGWFKENWQRHKMVAAGLPDVAFVQNNISYNDAAGTTRGIHAEPWDKYISVATGAIFGAWVDLREGPTFGVVFTATVGPGQAVFVPRGVGNSFQTVDPGTAYTYLVTDHWSAEAQQQYTFVNAADPDLSIDWPIPLEQAQRSAQDVAHPRLRDIVPMSNPPLLILGARGQVGSAVMRVCRERQVPYEAFTRDQWDLSRPETWPMNSVRGYHAVINTAAYTAVDRAQTPQGAQDAWAVNATGVAALTALCRAGDTPLVQVSTDYVFDGRLPDGQEYDVDSPVAPLSVYGQSKAAGDAAVRAWDKHWVVRTSWVIGHREHPSGGAQNFVDVMQGLAARGVDPQVVQDQVGRLTFAQDLAEALVSLVVGGYPYGTYHATNSGPVVSWAQVAQWVFELTGHDPQRVQPVTAAQYFADRTDAAPRPANSALNTERLVVAGLGLPDARTQLARYLGCPERAENTGDGL